jgi:hypothetical protein
MKHRDWTTVLLSGLLILGLTVVACVGCALPTTPIAVPEEKPAVVPQ